MITIQNVDRATRQILDHTFKLRESVSNIIVSFGNSIVEDLQVRYPDLTITGQFFPQSMEYWIAIARMGRELTWIRCPLSNLGFKKQRQDGHNFGKLTTITNEINQEFTSNVPVLDTDELVKEIADKLSLQINQFAGVK